MKNFLLLSLITSFLITTNNCAQSKGKLLIVGGVQTHEIEKKFVELAGGPDARIIIIPNAGSEPKRNCYRS